MASKHWFQVRNGFNYRCGAEWDVYHVRAYNEEQAVEMVRPHFAKSKKGEQVDVKMVGDDWWYIQEYEKDVYLTEHDYWSR